MEVEHVQRIRRRRGPRAGPRSGGGPRAAHRRRRRRRRRRARPALAVEPDAIRASSSTSARSRSRVRQRLVGIRRALAGRSGGRPSWSASGLVASRRLVGLGAASASAFCFAALSVGHLRLELDERVLGTVRRREQLSLLLAARIFASSAAASASSPRIAASTSVSITSCVDPVLGALELVPHARVVAEHVAAGRARRRDLRRERALAQLQDLRAWSRTPCGSC